MRASGHWKRSALTQVELVCLIVAGSILGFVLYSVLVPRLGGRQLPPRATCASNLRGIGQGIHIYSNDNNGCFPQYLHANLSSDGSNSFSLSPIDYAGYLGSTPRLSIRESNQVAETRSVSNPSRVEFMLVTVGTQTVGQFTCPASDDQEDDLRNYGKDQAVIDGAAHPGISRFDFRGYDKLSYGISLPFGTRRTTNDDGRLPIMADKGPYFEAGDEYADTRSRPDRRSAIVPPAALGLMRAGLLGLDHEKWRAWNSRNHNGEGQNVLYLDGHAEFVRTPLAGIDHDNIYTAATRSDPTGGLIGKVAEPGGATARIAPLTETDSYIVP